MSGGVIQIIARGAHDEYYTSTNNPDLILFKSIYRKFNHFGQELILLDDDNSDNTLKNFSQVNTLKYKISRNGDLINKIFMEFELPSIYSDDEQQFQWIRRIGEYIISEARIMSGNNYVYQRITGEYIHIYSETNLTQGSKHTYYDNIGNIPELYDPAYANNNNYPSSTKPSSGSNKKPSISKHRIILLIPFWFSTNPGLSLPLIASQKNEYNIEIDIRPLNEIYTIIDTDPTSSTFNTRIRPTEKSKHYLSNFTNITNNSSLSTIKINLYGKYYFLDNNLRNIFAKISHNYLLKQIQYYRNTTTRPTGGNLNIDLRDIALPITQFYFMFRRLDNENTNQWSNYTLWEYMGDKLINPTNDFFISEYNNQIDTTHTEYSYNTDIESYDIINTVELLINGNSYFNEQPVKIFTSNRYLYNYNDSANDELSGIYNYSFSLDNDKYQPSGIFNFTLLREKELKVKFKNINSLKRKYGEKFTGDYRIIIIFENLNILNIQGGLAGVKYVK